MYGAKLFMRSNLNINKQKSRFFLHFNATYAKLTGFEKDTYETYEFTQAFDKKISKQQKC